MTKKPLVLIIVILLLIGGGAAYLLTSSADKTAKQEMVSPQVDSTTTTVPTVSQETPASQPGTYVDYSSSAIADTASTKLLFFHAPWCPQCRDLDADIKRVGVPSGVTIIKVDYDTNQQLRQKYGVTIQTTIVRVDDAGSLVEKYVAYDEPTIDSVIKKLL